MQKVLITGLGIGKMMGLCDPCNLDFSWLFNNISTLLWTDKVCLPKDMFDDVIKEQRNKFDVAISIMLQTLKDYNLIELIDNVEFELQPAALNNMYIKVAKDLNEMMEMFPDRIQIHELEENNHLNIHIDNQEYCFPYISSIYASLFMAEAIGAQCILDDHMYTFLKYKSELNHKKISSRSSLGLYSDIFSFILPDDTVPPEYLRTREEACRTCVNEEKCSTTYEKATKEYIYKVLSYRNYDELYQLREEIENIVEQFISGGEDITSDDVKEELQRRQQRINHLIHRRFEQIKRWAKVASICSVPLSIVNVANGNIPAAIASASIAGLSEVSKKIMDIYESKKKWVGFLHLE